MGLTPGTLRNTLFSCYEQKQMQISLKENISASNWNVKHRNPTSN